MKTLLRTLVERPPQALPLPTGFRDAAVLVPVWEGQLLLTVRSAHLPQHAAQISFPGGRLDGDESIEQAALREAWEEVGLEASQVEIFGHLNPVLSPFGYRVFPLLAQIVQPPQLKPNPQEVDHPLWVPISELMQAPAYTVERSDIRIPPNISEDVRAAVISQTSGFKRRIWHYPWNGYDIWGLTGNIVHDLLERLRENRHLFPQP